MFTLNEFIIYVCFAHSYVYICHPLPPPKSLTDKLKNMGNTGVRRIRWIGSRARFNNNLMHICSIAYLKQCFVL